jgi:hypothetical protein
MTEDDFKRLQDHLLEHSKKAVLEHGHVGPMGFIITHVQNIDNLFESGYGVEFIDPKTAFVHDETDNTIVTLTIDLGMSWKKLYHAVLTVFPETQNTLPGLLTLGTEIKVDDPHKHLMRAFLSATELDTRDVIAAMMRQICDKTDAFASIFHSEAWQRAGEPGEARDTIPEDLGTDEKSIEVLISSMETYSFARMVTVPVLRAASKGRRDSGKVQGFGESVEMIDRPENDNVLEGRLIRFLKPQEIVQ